MDTGILLLNFGEPTDATEDAVADFLARIFYTNASLEDAPTAEAKWARSQELAARRAPGLIAEYEAIGGSPLNDQSQAQAEALEAELGRRGFDVRTFVGMQYTPPFVEDAVRDAHDAGVDRLIAIPVYPLCGPSTTVASLQQMRAAVEALAWDVRVAELTGWHRQPRYTRLRADNLRRFLEDSQLSLDDPGTTLVFSAHGTPQHYVDKGSRYVVYVREHCEALARLVQAPDYELGYQNHANRGIPWTEPEVESVIASLAEATERVVVEPVSFMHEQSETLSELDIELREEAASHGLGLHRVPIPHDDPAFAEVLADLAEPFVADLDPGYVQLRSCHCRPDPNALCLNAPR